MRFAKLLPVLCSVFVLNACSGGTENGSTNQAPIDNDTEGLPLISYAAIRDTDSRELYIGGDIKLRLNAIESDATALLLYWADDTGALLQNQQEQSVSISEHALNTLLSTQPTGQTQHSFNIRIPNNLSVPQDAAQVLLITVDGDNQELERKPIRIHDFRGNAGLAGTGGNELSAWNYSNTPSDRPLIPIHRQDNGLCVFDNGLVSVIDMESERDLAWEYSNGPNTVDDHAFQPYMFTCDANPSHMGKEIGDENGVWTYSVLNDSMYYGTLVYDMFLEQLGEPPLEDKIRLRVHYGAFSNTTAVWDGAYASFGDAMPFYYSMASLDIIAHEVAHGVLDRISKLKSYSGILSADARTVHEAFSDISGVMAKFAAPELSNQYPNLWVHSQGYHGIERRLDRIETEPGAIKHYLEYDSAGDNYYLRIGMLTYPFYLLSQSWGLNTSYAVYINAARTCWTNDTTLPEAAQCIQHSAVSMNLPEQEVIAAFATVQIHLAN